MGKLLLTKHIAAPPELVFELASDIPHWAENIEDIVRVEMLTEGEVGVGTRVRETRVMFGKENTEELEVTEFSAPTQYTLSCESCGSRYDSVHRFKPDGDGTLMEMDMTFAPMTFMAKLMTPVSWLFSGTMKKCIDRDLDQLKARAEERAAAGA